LGEDWGGGGGWEGFRGPRDTVLAEEPYPEPSIFSSRFRIASGQVGCPTLCVCWFYTASLRFGVFGALERRDLGVES